MKVSEKIKSSRLAKNVSWIFFGNLAHAILAFLLNILVARILDLNDNGMLVYAASWITFFTSVGTLGFHGIISREFSKNEGRANDYIWSCIAARLGFSVLAIVALQVIVRISSPNEPLLHLIVLCQSMSILFGSFDMFIYWYRYKNQANVTAIYRLIAFGISAAWRVFAVAVLKSLTLYVIGIVAETAFFMAFLYLFYRKNYTKKVFISKQTIFVMLKMSYPFIFSAVLATIYGQSDKIMIKNMIDNDAVSLYNASALIAGLVVIIPTTIIEGFRPDIMDAKLNDESLYRRRLRQLYAIIFWSCIAYGAFITILAKPIILILYGEKYLGAVSSLSLIVWYTSFSYFGAINNVYMVAEDVIKWVQVTTFTGAILNIILNYFLIGVWGIVGAALASLITQIFANFILMAVIPDLRKGFRIMLEGIALRNIK
ncbi:MAG: flippase [Clostridia bacterium]|nr:flippase [Clostridia bacterium]